MVELAPIHQLVVAELGWADQFFLWKRGAAGGGADYVEFLAVFLAAVAPVINLPGCVGLVAAVFAEVLGQGDEVFQLRHVAKPGRQPVDTGGAGAQPGHQAGTRRVAQGRLAVGVGESGATLGQAVDVWCFHHRMAAEIADPVVLVIDRDEQHVRFFLGRVSCNRKQQSR